MVRIFSCVMLIFNVTHRNQSNFTPTSDAQMIVREKKNRTRKTRQTNQSLRQKLSPFSRSCQSDQKALSCIIPHIFHPLRYLHKWINSMLLFSISYCVCVWFFSLSIYCTCMCYKHIFFFWRCYIFFILLLLILQWCFSQSDWMLCKFSHAKRSVYSILAGLACSENFSTFTVVVFAVDGFFSLYHLFRFCLCAYIALLLVTFIFATHFAKRTRSARTKRDRRKKTHTHTPNNNNENFSHVFVICFTTIQRSNWRRLWDFGYIKLDWKTLHNHYRNVNNIWFSHGENRLCVYWNAAHFFFTLSFPLEQKPARIQKKNVKYNRAQVREKRNRIEAKQVNSIRSQAARSQCEVDRERQ